jgi:hypothetical protein
MAELAAQLNGQGDVAILAGNQNAPNLQRRVQGVREEAAKHPGSASSTPSTTSRPPRTRRPRSSASTTPIPTVNGWAMIGGWALFTQSLLTDIDPTRMKIASVDGLPAQLPYIDSGIVPVLLAQPVYQWGYVGVMTIVDRAPPRARGAGDDPDGAGPRNRGEPGRLGASASRLGIHRRAGGIPGPVSGRYPTPPGDPLRGRSASASPGWSR